MHNNSSANLTFSHFLKSFDFLYPLNNLTVTEYNQQSGTWGATYSSPSRFLTERPELSRFHGLYYTDGPLKGRYLSQGRIDDQHSQVSNTVQKINEKDNKSPLAAFSFSIEKLNPQGKCKEEKCEKHDNSLPGSELATTNDNSRANLEENHDATADNVETSLLNRAACKTINQEDVQMSQMLLEFGRCQREFGGSKTGTYSSLWAVPPPYFQAQGHAPFA